MCRPSPAGGVRACWWHQFEILVHLRGGFAIIRFVKFVDGSLHIGLSVPEQFGHHIGAQFGILCSASLGNGAFHEQAHHPVILVHREVGGELVKIGEGQQVVGKVCVVVPDIELVGDLRPRLQLVP